MSMKTVKENVDIISFYSKRGYRVVSELMLPDDAGSWRECESWAAKAPFTLCGLEKDLGGVGECIIRCYERLGGRMMFALYVKDIGENFDPGLVE
jgi:hypothetical protein